jgi:oxaloacetate decarboxylase alpha subunit
VPRVRVRAREGRVTRSPGRGGSESGPDPPNSSAGVGYPHTSLLRVRARAWGEPSRSRHRLATLEEVGRVRAEMGYPIIVTPVSQQVATQAVRNVIDEERWSNVSDETIRYFLGHFGEPPTPVDADVAERVLARQRTDALRVLEPVGLDGARSRFGRTISDEELLLRLTMPTEQVDSIGASEPARAASRRASASEDPEHHPVVTLLDEVARRAAITHLRVETGDELVEWRRPS